MNIKRDFLQKKIFIMAMAVMMLIGLFSVNAFAQTEKGEYDLDADLSCYVTAMGGVEFGAPLLARTQLIVDSSGNESLKLTFSKNSVTIYSVTCDTFVDANPEYVTEDRGIKSGTIGIYDENGVLQTEGVDYSLSEDTALNATNEAVHYVDTIMFPIDSRRDVYNLSLYINSNVMGVQFCNANDKATTATYTATLTVSWGNLNTAEQDTQTANSTQSETGQTDVATQEPSSQTDASVEEMNGLTIHKVENESSAVTEKSNTVVLQRAYLNTQALLIIIIISAVIFITGTVMFITAKRRKPDEK